MIDAALLLPKILEQAGASHEMAEAAAIIAWKRVAGDGLSNHAKPLRLRGRTLFVEVADEAWKRQLQRMTMELESRINKLLRREIVTGIQFRINPAIGKQRVHSSKVRVVQSCPDNVRSSAGEIEDAELRERFIRAATNCIDRREAVIRSPQS